MRRTCLVAFAAAWLALWPGIVTSAVNSEDTLLFSVDKHPNGAVYADPIALLQYGHVNHPPVANLSEDFDLLSKSAIPFIEREYPASRPLYLLQSGQITNEFHVETLKEDDLAGGCSWNLSAKVNGTLPSLMPDRSALAINTKLLTVQSHKQRASNAEDLQAAENGAKELFANQHVSSADIAHMKKPKMTAYAGADGIDLIIAQYSIYIEGTSENRGDDAREYNSLIVVEKTDKGYVTTYTWFNQGTESRAIHQSLIDIFDVNGDGRPEIVTTFSYYEGIRYAILGRNWDGSWEPIFKSSYSGC
jgi:hypothetical protein